MCLYNLQLGDVIVYSKPQFQIPLAMFRNPNSKQVSDSYTESLVNPNLSEIMWICAYIHGHVFDRYNNWCLLIARFVNIIGVH